MSSNNEVLIKTRGLKTYFPIKGGVFRRTRGYVRAVDNVNLEIKSGRIVSVVGESGCGKSTLGNSLLGLVKPTAGEITLNEQYVNIRESASWNRFRKDFQIIFQDPYSSLNPKHTIFETLSGPLLVHDVVHKSEIREKVGELLERVGLSPEHMDRFPHTFSGGQRQRVGIARAIGLGPKLIVCDEVTASLDVSVQAQIIELLLKLKEELDLSLLFISHDLSVVKAISDEVHVMYLGKIVESARTTDLFKSPRHPYTRALLDSIPTLDRNKKPAILEGEVPSPANPPSGCAFHTRCLYAQDKCKVETPEMGVEGERKFACFYPLQ